MIRLFFISNAIGHPRYKRSLYMRLPKNKNRIKADKNKEDYSYDEKLGTICFHSAVCLKGFE